MNTLVSSWFLPISGLMTAIFAGWFFNRAKCAQEFLKGSTWEWLFRPWLFMVQWIAPAVTLLIILYKSGVIDDQTLSLLW